MIFHKYFNNKQIKKYRKDIRFINEIYEQYKNLPNIDFAKMLLEQKNENHSRKNKIYWSIAIAKIASLKVLGMTYYDVQIMGALALIEGKIAQMKTGEGKTLMCSAAVAANFVLGYKTHVATANEYLAKRDEETLKPLYKALGIKSDYNIAGLSQGDKKLAYQSDVLYSTSQEMGFDYLRDNLVKDIKEKIQLQDFLNVMCVIDEADFILIDEARTPLIISGSSSSQDDVFYKKIREIALKLKQMSHEPEKKLKVFGSYVYAPGDFWIDYRSRTVHIFDDGYSKIEIGLLESGLVNGDVKADLYTAKNIWLIDEILNGLKAQYLFIKDKDYVIQDNKIVIVDENTGRLSKGRTWSDGLHQAIEAKENVTINSLTSILRTISIQNYFRHYGKISGMTGTALVCKEEFEEIYNCPVVEIPTNKNMIRKDYPDKVFMESKHKYEAIIKDIKKRNAKSQPILVGTTSVNESEIISKLLIEKNIFHYVLNAKNHALEAQIISQAGIAGAVTVATSMAGRGTDIILGGNKEEIIKIKKSQIETLEQIKLNLINSLSQTESDESFFVLPKEFLDLVEIQLFIDGMIYNEYKKEINLLRIDLINVNKLIETLIAQTNNITTNWQSNRQAAINAGGLCVVGCSRNESRRVDDQIRGRSGRQGDIGESIFYISFEDNWLQVFARSSLFKVLKDNFESDQPVASKFITSSIENAQKTIEGLCFDDRKNIFQYDSILDESRVNFFKVRDQIITTSETMKKILIESVGNNLKKIKKLDYLLKEEIFVNNTANSVSLSIDKILDHNLIFETRLEILTILLEHLFSISYSSAIKMSQILEVGSFWKKIESDEINSDGSFQEIMEQCIMDYFSLMESEFWTWFKLECVEEFDNIWINYLLVTRDIKHACSFSKLVQKNPLYEYKKSCYELFKNSIFKFKKNMLDNMLSKIEFNV